MRDISSCYCTCGRFFFFQAEDGIRDLTVTGVQTCALPIFNPLTFKPNSARRRPRIETKRSSLFSFTRRPAAIRVSGPSEERADGLKRSVSTDRKSTRLNSSHSQISYAVFCLKKKNNKIDRHITHPNSNKTDYFKKILQSLGIDMRNAHVAPIQC